MTTRQPFVRRILHRSAEGVVSIEERGVVLRARSDLHASEQHASIEDFRSGKLDAAILEAFDLATLVETLARDIIAERSLLVRQDTSSAEHAGRSAVQRTWSFGRGDPRAVWIRARAVSAMAGDERYEASFDEHLATGLPAPVRDALGSVVVDAVRSSVLALHPLPCFCHTGVETIEQHGMLETIVWRDDPRAPIDVRAEVAWCTVCHTGWTFEARGDSHYKYDYAVRAFEPQVADA